MKILSILFLVSVTLNVCFLTGCQALHDAVYGNPCKYRPLQPAGDDGKYRPLRPAGDDGKSELVRIANLLDIKTGEKSASDLSFDIRYKLDRCVDVPKVFDKEAFQKMEKDLRSSEKDAMREYQSFISSLQGKRVIVIEPEE